MFPQLRFTQAGASAAELAAFQREFDALPPAAQASRLQQLAGASSADIAALIANYRDASAGLSDLSKSELSDVAADAGVSASGTKNEIAARIKDAGSLPGPAGGALLGVGSPPATGQAVDINQAQENIAPDPGPPTSS
jgi:hypothetical protein